MNRIAKTFLVAIAMIASISCKHDAPPPLPQSIDYAQELPPGALALRKLSPSEYPDFSAGISAFNVRDLSRSIDNSLVYLATPSSQAFYPYEDISHDRAVASLKVLKQLVTESIASSSIDQGRQFDSAIKSTFEVYKSIGAPNPDGGYTGKVLFTGYFTPIYKASLTRGGPFQYPLYKRPIDLDLDPTGQFAYRRDNHGPYYTRRQIEQQHVLDGQELVWLTDRFDAYVITVQGSARLELPDGQMYEIGYAGNNGYPYTAPGLRMLSDGLIRKDELTLRGLRNYFAMHPQAMDQYLPLNDRYIFFAQRPGGPFGSLNVAVTPFATIATDKSVYPRAMPAFLTVPVATPIGGKTPFRGFMMDQDTGGGIRASGRCDIFMGVGPPAEALAGPEDDAGELYYLAVKPELVRRSLGGN